jgi:hypothetical protein
VVKAETRQKPSKTEAEVFLGRLNLRDADRQLVMGKVFDQKTFQELATICHKSESWVSKTLNEPYVKLCSSQFESFLKEPRWMRNVQERLLQVSGVGQKRKASPVFKDGRLMGYLFVMLMRRHDQHVAKLNDPSAKQAAVAAEACKNLLCSFLQYLLVPLTNLLPKEALRFCEGSTTWIGEWPVTSSGLKDAAEFYKGFGSGIGCKPKDMDEIMQQHLVLPLIWKNRVQVENMRQRGETYKVIVDMLRKQMSDEAKAAWPDSQAEDAATFEKFVARVKKTCQRVGLKIRDR